MLGFPNVWKYVSVGSGVALILLGAWAFRVDHLRGVHLRDLNTLRREAQTVVIALQTASGNSRVIWSNTPNQILALGDEKRQWQETSNAQTTAIQGMQTEAERLRARAAKLQQIADAAQAKRRAALKRLGEAELTPGDREDCETLLREANEALDLVYKEGL